MTKTPTEIDSQDERLRRFSLGVLGGTLGVCCAFKVLILSSLAFSGAATASRAWARVGLLALALLAAGAAVVLARRRRACRAVVPDDARAITDQSSVGVDGGRIEASLLGTPDEFPVGPGRTSR